MVKEIKDQQAWNNFILSCPTNTFLHSWQWGQVQAKSGEEVTYLGVFNNDQLVAAALAILVKAKRGKHYLIPHGPIAKNEDSVKKALPQIINYLKQSKEPGACAIRIAPLLINNQANLAFFKQQGLRPAPLHVHAELTWVLNIDKPQEQLLSGMRKTTRHAIKKAQTKGVTVSTVSAGALDRFWKLYEQTKHRHQFTPWPYDLLASQLNEFNDKTITVIAQHNNKDVASAILIHFGNTVYYHHGASAKLPSSIPASQLLQWHVIQEAQKRQATHYNFWGIAPDNKQNHPFSGITTFKKGFGGEAIDYMHAQDLPLSLSYWKLWLVDTIRKKKRGF